VGLTDRLNFLLTLDPAEAVAGVGKVGKAVKKSADEVVAETKRMQAALDKVQAKQTKLTAKGDLAGAEAAGAQAAALESKLAGLTQSGGAAGGVLGKLGLAGTAAGGGLSSAAVGAGAAGVALVAVGGAAKFLEASIQKTAELEGEVRALQRTSGATAEQASALTFTFKRMGIDADAGAKGLYFLGKNVENSQDKLTKLGVTVAHDSKGNVDLVKTLANVGDAYKGSADQAQRNAIAAAAFGRSGQALIPVLSTSREELEGMADLAAKQGLIFHDEDLQAGKEFNRALSDVHTAIQGIEVDAGKGLLPLATDLLHAAASGATLAHQLHAVDIAVKGWEALTPGVNVIVGARNAWDEVTGSTDENTDATKENTAATEQNAEARSKQAAAVLDLQPTLERLIDAEDRLAAAHKAVADAASADADKAEKVAAAKDAETRATENLADAEERLAQAKRQQPRDETRARLAVQDADRAVADAQKKADRYKRRPADNKERVQAEEDLTKALLDQQDARDRLDEAKKGKGTRDAQRAVDDAKRAQGDAEKKKKEADAIDPNAQRVKAEDDLRKAEEDRATAQQKAQEAIDGANDGLAKSLDLTTATREQLVKIVSDLKDAAKIIIPSLPGSAAPATNNGIDPGTGIPLLPGVPGRDGQLPPVVSHVTTFGPITVQASDPAEMERKLDAQYRLKRIGGPQ
jgi:hypothetical protein